MKKYIIGFSLLWTSIFTPSVYSLNILEPVLDHILNLTEDEVEQRIGKIQNEVPVGTPTISGGFDQKGYVGSILANIFDEATQKIKSNFILAFTDILGATHNNNIPKWNGDMFKPGTMSDVSGMIGIGISNPTTKLDVAGHIRTTNQVRANNYCDTDGNNCVAGSNLSSLGADNLGDHIATQNLSMGNFRITNLSDPTQNQNAATKKYVDDSKLSCKWVTWAGGNGNGRFELKSGDPNTSGLNFSGRRYMVEAGSVSQRCRQLGYDFGTATQQFSGWCSYSNARTAYFHQAASNGSVGWRSEGCSNKSVAAALCCSR